MTAVVLFHSAAGLTPAVRAFAADLEADGHRVVTPDLFEGRTFRTTAEGARHRDAVGLPVLLARAFGAAGALPEDVVYAGFSMGAAAAAALAVGRPGARGALLMHGAVSLELLGVPRWPAVPVALHTSPGDPEVDGAGVERLAAAVHAAGVACEHHRYPGTGHLFTDPAMPEHDRAASALLARRAREFVRACAAR